MTGSSLTVTPSIDRLSNLLINHCHWHETDAFDVHPAKSCYWEGWQPVWMMLAAWVTSGEVEIRVASVILRETPSQSCFALRTTPWAISVCTKLSL